MNTSTIAITSNVKIFKLIELIKSEPNVYGNWTMQDFEYWTEDMTESEIVQFLEDIIAEGSDWIVE
jgi:hypothetical protein